MSSVNSIPYNRERGRVIKLGILAVAKAAKAQGKRFPTYARIGPPLGTTKKSVENHTLELKRLGVIKVNRHRHVEAVYEL